MEERHKQRLAQKKAAGQPEAARKVHELKLARIAKTSILAESEASRFLDLRELLWVIGTVLYWAEGTKIKQWSHKEQVQFTNMDPDMIRVVRGWLVRYCSMTSDDFDYAPYIHPDGDVTSAQKFWSDNLGIPQERLRTYFKKHNPSTRRKHVGRTYYGTMRMTVRRSALLTHRITGWIRAIAARCGVD